MTEQDEFEFRHRLEQEASTQPQQNIIGNAVQDLKDIPKSLGNTIKEGAYDMPKRALETGLEMASGKSYADTPSGKQDASLVANAPQMAKDALKPITHPIDYAMEHPVNQALNVASLGLGGASAAEIPETMAKYAGRFGENSEIKMLGGTRGQLAQLGPDEARNIARQSHNMGLDDLTLGPIGREEQIKAMLQQSGHEIGDIRDQASTSKPALSPTDMAAKIQEALKDKYQAGGVNASDAPTLQKMLENIKQMKNPSMSDYAQRVTDINKDVAGKKLVQPTNVDTDVANSMAKINDQGITSGMSPEDAENYSNLKDTFGTLKTIDPMEQRGEIREMGSRGSNSLFGAVNKMVEASGGFKASAQAGFAAEGLLKNVAKNAGAYSMGGVTSAIMSTLQSNPQALGKYAAPLAAAAQKNGNQGIAATHFILSQQDPEYGKLMNGDSQDQ